MKRTLSDDENATISDMMAPSKSESTDGESLGLRYYLKLLVMLVMWYCGGATKSIVNKLVFTHFKFPLTVLQTQLILQASFTSLILVTFTTLFGVDLISLGKPHKQHGHSQSRAVSTSASTFGSGSSNSVRGDRGIRSSGAFDDMVEVDAKPVAHNRPASISLWEQTVVIMPFTILHLSAHVFSQFSLSLIPVWMLKVVKSVSPVFTVGLSYLVLGDTFDGWMILSLVPIVTGVVLCGIQTEPVSAHKATFRLVGLLLGVGSAVTYVGEKIAAKKLFLADKANPFHLLVHSNIIASIMLLPIWYFVDYRNGLTITTNDTYYLLLANGLVDSFLGLGMLLVLTQLSALSHQIAAAGDRIFVMVVSVIVFNNHLSTMQIAGIVVCCAGMFLYQKAKSNHDRKLEQSNRVVYAGLEKGDDVSDTKALLSDSRWSGGLGGRYGGDSHSHMASSSEQAVAPAPGSYTRSTQRSSARINKEKHAGARSKQQGSNRRNNNTRKGSRLGDDEDVETGARDTSQDRLVDVELGYESDLPLAPTVKHRTGVADDDDDDNDDYYAAVGGAGRSYQQQQQQQQERLDRAADEAMVTSLQLATSPVHVPPTAFAPPVVPGEHSVDPSSPGGASTPGVPLTPGGGKTLRKKGSAKRQVS